MQFENKYIAMLHHKILIAIGICAAPDETNRLLNLSYIVVGALVTIILTTAAVGSGFLVAKQQG